MVRPSPRRLGFTLTELLILLGLIAMIVALLITALPRTRRTEGGAYCRNNLKQICLAVHNYAGTYNLKLPAVYSAPKTEVLINDKWITLQNPQSFFLTLLPFIEQDNMYKAGMSASVQAGAPSDTKSDPPSNFTWLGRVSNGSGGTGNLFQFGFVKLYVCPTDPTNSTQQPTACGWVGSSFAANYQVFGTEDWKPKYNIGNIPDGTSNTVFIAERFAQYPGPAGQFIDPDGRLQQGNTLWAWPANYPPNPPTAYTSPVPENAAIFAYSNLKTGEGYGDMAFSLPQIGIRPEQADYRLVQSGHQRAVQIGMGDGSARGVSVTVRPQTWANALIPDDGQPLGDDW
jgi:hypothetical protein